MNKLKHIAILLVFIPLGCSAPDAAIYGLEQIHRAPAEGESCLNRQGRQLLRYNSSVAAEKGEEAEEVDDPVSFCREQIAELRGMGRAPLGGRGAAVYVLCFVGSRSPTAHVRLEAMETLRAVCRDDAAAFRFREPNAAEEEWNQRRKEWLELYEAHSQSDGVSAEERSRVRELLAYFGSLDCDSAWRAWETLALLTVRSPLAGKGTAADDALRAEMDKAVQRFIGQAFFFTAGEGLFDSSEFVVREALDSFFLFNPEDIMPPLTELIERCYDGPLRIRILDRLAACGLEPSDLGARMMIQVRDSLEYGDPGVIFHAVQLLKSLTGIDSDDPGYWKSWWSDYLREHADELKDRSRDDRLRDLPDRNG